MVQEDENMVMKAVRNVGVNVDKGELIKALQYDRNQYSKGYEDGKNDVLDKIRAKILDNAFSVVNPYNTYEYINVIDLDSIDEILDEYKAAGVRLKK